jgi:hypothetical protein
MATEILSPSGRFKVKIETLPDGTFDLSLFKLTEEYLPAEGIVIPPFWSEQRLARTLVAEASVAETIAHEILRNVSGEVL